MYKKFFALFCLILFVCSVSFASASDDFNQSISEDMQSGDELVIIEGDGTFSELQEKINNPENESVVNLDKDYIYDRKEVDFTMSVDDAVVGDDLVVDFNISSDIEQRDEYYGYAAGGIRILRMMMNQMTMFGLLMIIFILRIMISPFLPCHQAVT